MPAGNIISGRTVVTTAGTAVQLSTTIKTLCSSIAIQAESDNTGRISVGASTTIAAAGATANGIYLAAGSSIVIDTDQLSDIYINSTVNGDGVVYIATVA